MSDEPERDEPTVAAAPAAREDATVVAPHYYQVGNPSPSAGSSSAPRYPAPPLPPCARCGRGLGGDDRFCPGCGIQREAALFRGGPAAPPPVVLRTAPRRDAEWWAAMLVLVVGTPIGCFVIPAIIALLVLAAVCGMAAWPSLVGAGMAILTWTFLPAGTVRERAVRVALAAVVAALGLLANGLWLLRSDLPW